MKFPTQKYIRWLFHRVLQNYDFKRWEKFGQNRTKICAINWANFAHRIMNGLGHPNKTHYGNMSFVFLP